MIRQLSPQDRSVSSPAPDVDETVRSQISDHFDHRVRQERAQLQSKLAELEQAVTAAEAARGQWNTTGEITSTAAIGDPRTASAVDKEVFALTLSVDWPCHEAWEAARDNPEDPQTRAEFLAQQARVTAVQQWLDEHGYGGHAQAGNHLGWDLRHIGTLSTPRRSPVRGPVPEL